MALAPGVGWPICRYSVASGQSPRQCIALEKGVPPSVPGVPGVEAPQVRLLIIQHPIRFVLRDNEQQLVPTTGEVIEELALAGAGRRPDVVHGISTVDPRAVRHMVVSPFHDQYQRDAQLIRMDWLVHLRLRRL